MVIFINEMKVRAYHGVLPQERIVGTDFTVSIRVECTPLPLATEDDCLDGTISYADLARIIKVEMATPSNLLEHVATRIARKVMESCPMAERVWLRVTKFNPPMDADTSGAGVELEVAR